MSSGMLLGFVVVALLAVLTPGLDTMLMLRYAVMGGWRAGFLSLIGISLGCAVWGTASVAGLTAVLRASQLAYDAVRVAGACYLCWLGASALWKSMRRNRSPEDAPEVPVARPSAALRAGLTTNLLNPKVGVFYMSLLPQFLPAGAIAWGAALVAIHVGIGLIWMSTLLSMAAKLRTYLLRDRVRRWLDRLSATVLIAFGLRLAAESN
ncbi:LysE family translocator [Nocardia arthritidis]|nr:LysE family translocator [Nocardia arthritidis]